MSALANKTNVKVEWENPTTNQYEIVETQNFSVPEIEAGKAVQSNYGLTFANGGKYRVITYSDTEFKVTEREENNNSSDIGIQTGKRKDVFITVLSQEGDSKNISKPVVKIRLISTKSFNNVTL